MIALYLFGLYLGRLRGALSEEEARRHAQQLAELPVKIEHLLNESDEIEELAKEFFRSTDFLYLGRGINFPVANEGDEMSSVVSDHVIESPQASDLLSPILAVIPLQLLAYHIAVRRGCDVDQPRNLAKSVT